MPEAGAPISALSLFQALQKTNVPNGGLGLWQLLCDNGAMLAVICEFSSFLKGTFGRILMSAIKQLKKFIIRLLLWLHFPITY